MTEEIQKAITAAVDEAIKAAVSGGNYEAVVLVIVMLGGMAFACVMSWLMLKRHLAVEERTLGDATARESRMAERLNGQEQMIRDLQKQQAETLMAVIRDCTGVMAKMLAAADSIVTAANRMTDTLTRFSTILETRPCLLDALQAQTVVSSVREKLNAPSGKD